MPTTRDRQSAASIRARLLARAKRDGDDFQRVLIQYANERLLYRLSRSRHRDSFVLKGASLFALWHGRIPRATKDVDLLGAGTPSPARLEDVFREVLRTEVEPDALVFELESLHAEPIREEAPYQGVRVTVRASLGSASLALQIDVGFGDAVEPSPEVHDYPTLLEMQSPRLSMYRREVSIAEKYHAMVLLGMTNSRMKDYFDVAFLAQHHEFEAALLGRAIAATFARRSTPLPVTVPQGLSPIFSDDRDKQKQWNGFIRRVDAASQLSLPDAVTTATALLWPITLALVERGQATGTWRAGAWQAYAGRST